jgi:hypothetical protein
MARTKQWGAAAVRRRRDLEIDRQTSNRRAERLFDEQR